MTHNLDRQLQRFRLTTQKVNNWLALVFNKYKGKLQSNKITVDELNELEEEFIYNPPIWWLICAYNLNYTVNLYLIQINNMKSYLSKNSKFSKSLLKRSHSSSISFRNLCLFWLYISCILFLHFSYPIF